MFQNVKFIKKSALNHKYFKDIGYNSQIFNDRNIK